jgi:hypothetical protein
MDQKQEFFTKTEQDPESGMYVQFISATWPMLPLSVSIMYLLFVIVAPHLMEQRKSFQLKKSVAVWNFLLTVFSCCGMVRVVPCLFYLLKTSTFHDTICLDPEYLDKGAVGLWSMLFVFSKMAELLDTVFLVLNKKKLVFLHWYHHLTVLLLSWHAYLSRSPISIYAMSMNYSIHSPMYGYYFLRSIGKWPRWLSPQFITVAQISQMIVGSGVCMVGIFYKLQDPQCHAPMSNIVFATFIYWTYLFLFVQFFFRRFEKKKIFQTGKPLKSQV